MTVIATSSAVSARTVGRNLINLRLGMLLEIASRCRRRRCGLAVAWLSDADARSQVRVRDGGDRDHGVLAPRAAERAGFLRRIRAGSAAVFMTTRAAATSSTGSSGFPLRSVSPRSRGSCLGSLGIGGGILKVPLLNAWCGVPLRAAAATSALMIGVTAAASAPLQYANHYIQPPLAAAAVHRRARAAHASACGSAAAPRRAGSRCCWPRCWRSCRSCTSPRL